MQKSPLSLEKYAFSRIHVDACESPECQTVKTDGHFRVQTRCQQHGDDLLRWMVTLNVSVVKKEAEPCPPYTFDVEVVGFFKVAEDCPADKQAVLVRANGPAVLFGSVREMIASLTARGPYPRVDLPTVTFIDEAHKKPAESKA
jgi:preprotein translocase subunit SecB